MDDDEGIRKSLSAALKTAGYVVDTGENGKEAIQKSNANFYNLALIDIRLPDMERTELLTATSERTPKTIKIKSRSMSKHEVRRWREHDLDEGGSSPHHPA